MCWTLAGDPDEKCVALVQPGGGKGMDEVCGVGKGECGTEFGNVPEVEKVYFAQVFDVVVKGKMRVQSYIEVGNC